MTATPVTVDVALRDGATVCVRPMRPGDEPGLRDLLEHLSDRSRWLRFFSGGVDLHGAASYMASLELGQGRALVAVAGDPEWIVAHAAYIRETPERAEVAFEVADEWHGRGVATVLLAHLSELAVEDGIATFTAVVLAENHRMVGVFRDSGFAVDVSSHPGELRIELSAQLGPEARARFEDRERSAAAAAVAHVLRPASVAVLGNLRAAGYRGRLAVVHPRHDHIDGVPAYRSIADVPESVELAVIAVP